MKKKGRLKMIINYCDFQFELYSSYDDRKYDNKKIINVGEIIRKL